MLATDANRDIKIMDFLVWVFHAPLMWAGFKEATDETTPVAPQEEDTVFDDRQASNQRTVRSCKKEGQEVVPAIPFAMPEDKDRDFEFWMRDTPDMRHVDFFHEVYICLHTQIHRCPASVMWALWASHYS